MLKVKLRNTRENLPTIKLDQIEDLYHIDQLFEDDKITLRLVNHVGITFDTTFTVWFSDDGNVMGTADGWNTYGLPLQRNNKPFELGVCAAEAGEEIIEKFGSAAAAAEDDFEEFDETDDEESEKDDFEEFDDEEEVAPKKVAASRPATPKHSVKEAAAPAKKQAKAPQAAPLKTKRASKTPYADALKKYGTKAAAARALGIGVDAFRYRYEKEQA